jgi:hypothetical protein
MNRETYILDDLYANREPRLYTECPTLRSERFGLKVIEVEEHKECIKYGDINVKSI